MKPVVKVQNVSKLYSIKGTQTKTLSELFGWNRRPRTFAPIQRSGQIAEVGPEPGTFWALKDISFEVQPGEILGIFGKNGSGKSTLMKILSRITAPTKGRAVLKGRFMSLLEVGTGFHPDLTGRENIYLNAAILGMRKSEVDLKLDEIIDFSQIGSFIDTPVKFYSSGMYLRLAFSVAAHLETEILILDEVLSIGDLDFQQKCLRRILDISRQGKTIIFVSHSMRHITDICSRAIYISGGKAADEGDPEDLVEKYIRAIQKNSTGSTGPMEHFTQSSFFKIEKAVIKNSDGENSANLLFKEPFTVDVEVSVSQSLKNVRIGAGFATLSETWIGRVHHPSAEKEKLDLEPGRYLISFSFSNCLWPGTYYLGVGAHQAADKASVSQTLDYIPRAMRFAVEDIAGNSSIPSPAPHNHGLVALEAQSGLKRLK